MIKPVVQHSKMQIYSTATQRQAIYIRKREANTVQLVPFLVLKYDERTKWQLGFWRREAVHYRTAARVKDGAWRIKPSWNTVHARYLRMDRICLRKRRRNKKIIVKPPCLFLYIWVIYMSTFCSPIESPTPEYICFHSLQELQPNDTHEVGLDRFLSMDVP